VSKPAPKPIRLIRCPRCQGVLIQPGPHSCAARPDLYAREPAGQLPLLTERPFAAP
jgi:hypothetical protein